MQKKKILIIGPVSAHSSEIQSILNSLSFLQEQFSLEALDSLSIMENVSNEAYYALWKEKLSSYMHEYSAFIGFAFGGVILQQCAELLAQTHQPILLFSSPSFANKRLKEQLGEVIRLCEEHKLEEALQALYQPVFAPNPIPEMTLPEDRNKAFARLIFGLSRVLHTDSTAILKKNTAPILHFIGEYSDLVNVNNVIAPNNGELIVVPHSSMRVLQDNPVFCHKIVLETLNANRSRQT